MNNIKLENGSIINNLTFEESFNGKFVCYTGHYNDLFFIGSNETGTFEIMNYKDFGWNQLVISKLKNIIENEYNKLRNNI